MIELLVQAHGVVDPRAVLHEMWKDVVDVVDGKRIVRAVIASGAFRSGAMTIPCFTRRIAFTREQDEFGSFATRYQHRHGFGLGEAGEVEKITVGPIVIEDVAVARLL